MTKEYVKVLILKHNFCPLCKVQDEFTAMKEGLNVKFKILIFYAAMHTILRFKFSCCNETAHTALTMEKSGKVNISRSSDPNSWVVG